jgi:hypothetical protein
MTIGVDKVGCLAPVGNHLTARVAHDLPARNPDVIFRRLESEGILVHMGTNHMYALSATGARFWELYSEGRTRTEIEEQLLVEFDVSREQLRAEIDSLLGDLARERLVGDV